MSEQENRKKCANFIDSVVLELLTSHCNDQSRICWCAGNKKVWEIKNLKEFIDLNSDYLYKNLDDEFRTDVNRYFEVKNSGGNVYDDDTFYCVHYLLYDMFPTVNGEDITESWEDFLKDYFECENSL